MKITKKSRLTIILFILPALIVYLMWVIYPIISAIWMSMQKSDTLHSSHFVGIENYISVFKARLFWKSMKISFIFIIFTTIFQVILGFFMAILCIFSPEDTGSTRFCCLSPMYCHLLPPALSGVIFTARAWVS